MSTEPAVVTRQPAVQSNPFAKGQSEHLSAGTVAIESERAIAEAQGKLVIAKRFPRNQALAYANIIDACRRVGLADEACYSFPRGGEVVSGPTIRLAEMLAANWGNLDYGIRELSRKEGVSEMEAYAWDLESNVMSSQKFTVRHVRDTKHGQKQLTDERDIYELTANLGARRLRARVLAVIPADLIQAAVDECGKTAAKGGDVPIQDRIRKMLVAFKSLGVPVALIEARLKHPVDSSTGEELADLLKIHNSLRDGASKLGDWFGVGEKSEGNEPEEGTPSEETPKRATPPPRSKKGAAAVAETTTSAPTDATMPPVTPPAQPEPKSTDTKPITTTAQAEAKAKAADLKASEPKASPEPPANAPTTPAPKQRVFLEKDEEITALVTVKSSNGLNIQIDNVNKPSVSAIVEGEFVGTIYQYAVEGVTIKDVNGKKEVSGIPAHWAPGTKLRVGLKGRHFPQSGKVYALVSTVEPLTGSTEAELS